MSFGDYFIHGASFAEGKYEIEPYLKDGCTVLFAKLVKKELKILGNVFLFTAQGLASLRLSQELPPMSCSSLHYLFLRP